MVVWTLFSDDASTIKQTSVCLGVHSLCLKLKKAMYSLKENAAAALKLSLLYWSVQCYIFVVLKNKTHQQINRLIVS